MSSIVRRRATVGIISVQIAVDFKTKEPQPKVKKIHSESIIRIITGKYTITNADKVISTTKENYGSDTLVYF